MPRAQIIAGFPVDFEMGRIINALQTVIVLFSCFGKANTPPFHAMSGFARMSLSLREEQMQN